MTSLPSHDPAARDLTPLRERLQQTEARVWRRNVGSLLAWLLGGAALSFAVYFGLDFLTHVPGPVRLLLTLGVLGVFGVWLPRRTRRYWQREADVHRLARKVEREVAARRSGGFGSVLVSGLEFGTRPQIGGSAVLKDRVVNQALGPDCDPLRVDLHDHALQRRGLRLLGGAALLYLLWLLLSPATLGIFLQRAIGLDRPYPTRTRIVEVSYPAVVPSYRDVEVTVRAAGQLPGSGSLRLRFAGESAYDLPLVPRADGDGYSATIAAPAKDAIFEVRLGDGRSPDHRLRVVRPPAAVAGELAVTPPAYTKLTPRTYALANASVPAGSSLSWRVQPDRPVSTAELVLGDRTLPLTRGADGAWSLAAVTLDAPAAYSIRLVDAEGIENTDRLSYRLGVVADRAPAVRLAKPEPESYWAPVSQVHWEARLSDDYGLQALRLRLQTATPTEEGGEQVVATQYRDLPLSAGQLDATLEGRLRIADTGVEPGQMLLLTVQARDLGPAAEADADPGTLWHDSEQLRLHIVSATELRAIILAEEQIAYKQIGDISDDVKHQIRMLQMQEHLNEDKK